jgi:hypothetical protein
MDDGRRTLAEKNGDAHAPASHRSALTAADIERRQRLIRLTLRAAAVSTLRMPRDEALVAQLIARARTLSESLEGDAASMPDAATARYAQQSAREFYADLATLSARIAQSG